MREKKNENDNREPTKGGIVLSVWKWRARVKTLPKRVKGAACRELEGQPLLPLLQTTSPPSHLPRILPQVPVCCMMSVVVGPKISWPQKQNTALMIKHRHGVSKLSVFSLKKRMGKVNATLCFYCKFDTTINALSM